MLFMIFNNHNRSCHPERSEGSLGGQILRCAQDDNTVSILVVKFHQQPHTIVSMKTFRNDEHLHIRTGESQSNWQG